MFGTKLRAAALVAAALASGASSVSAATIGVAMPWFDDVWLTTLRQGIEGAAAKDGIKTQSEDANGDVGRQLDQVANLVASGVDALIVSPVDTSATLPMTKLAKEAGIPIIYVARKPEEPLSDTVVYVGSDERTSGRMQAKAFAEALGGKGKVVLLQGELAVNTTTVRSDGVRAVLADYPGIEIVQEPSANYQRQQASDIVTNILTSGEKIDGYIANNDEMAIGAILALQAAGQDPKPVVIAGIDGTREALNQMKEGNLDVTVFHNAAAQAVKSVEVAAHLIAGEKVEPENWIPFEFVTPATAEGYLN